MSEVKPSDSLAVLRGATEDYARLLLAQGNNTTSGMVSGICTQAAEHMARVLRETEMIRVQLSTLRAEYEKRQEITNRLAKADTEILPQSLEIEVGK